MNAMAIIASQVSPKLMSATAAGSYASVPARREVRAEGRSGQEVGDRELADDDGQRQEGAAQQRHAQVRQDDPDDDGGPAGAQALGRLGQAPDVDGPQARVDGAVHVRQRQHDVGRDEQDVLPMSVWSAAAAAGCRPG